MLQVGLALAYDKPLQLTQVPLLLCLFGVTQPADGLPVLLPIGQVVTSIRSVISCSKYAPLLLHR